MWGWINKVAKDVKVLVVGKPKSSGFTGFRVELYRDGVLLTQQLGTVYNNMEYNFPTGAVKIDGVLLHRYRLITEVENYSDRRG